MTNARARIRSSRCRDQASGSCFIPQGADGGDAAAGLRGQALPQGLELGQQIAHGAARHQFGDRLAATGDQHSLQENPGSSTIFLQALQHAIPGFHDLKLERVGRETRSLLSLFEINDVDYSLGLDELSDGQKMLLALYGLLHFTGPSQRTVLLDEPDNYLSLPEIQPWLVELSDQCDASGLQVVIASHHPEVIDDLGAQAGVILEREVTGVTQVKRLSSVANDQDLKRSEIMARGWEL